MDHQAAPPPGSREQDLSITANQTMPEWIVRFPFWLVGLFVLSIWVAAIILIDLDFREAFLYIRAGLQVTITTSLMAYAIALLFGLIAGLGRISSNLFTNNLATFYVELVRGVPMLVLLFYIALVGVPTVIEGFNFAGNRLLAIRTITDDDDLNTQAAWSPDDQYILFTSQAEEDDSLSLSIVTPRQRIVQPVTNGPEDSYGVWSPDSSRVAYQTGEAGDSDILIVPVGGGSPITLAASDANELFPAWSPNGSRIAYAVKTEDGYDLVVTAADGSSSQPINGDISVHVQATSSRPNLAWSPDGTQIAFMAHGAEGIDIYLASTDGSGIAPLVEGPADDLFPVWSPDGSQIAFTSKQGGRFLNIYIVGLDGGEPVPVTNLQGDSQYAAWSPDGSQIAFSARVGENVDVYLINANGRNLRRLTYLPGEERAPSWSSDGSRIAFVGVQRSNPDIFTVSTGTRPFAWLGRLLTSLDNRAIPLNARAVIALAVTYGAFLAEIFRAGIQSVDRGQMEAARALGMSRGQAMRYIILPQAIRNMLPALGNDFVAMVKDTSLVSALGVQDITRLAGQYAGSSFRYRESYLTLVVLYLTMTVLLSLLVRVIERRLRSDE